MVSLKGTAWVCSFLSHSNEFSDHRPWLLLVLRALGRGGAGGPREGLAIVARAPAAVLPELLQVPRSGCLSASRQFRGIGHTHAQLRNLLPCPFFSKNKTEKTKTTFSGLCYYSFCQGFSGLIRTKTWQKLFSPDIQAKHSKAYFSFRFQPSSEPARFGSEVRSSPEPVRNPKPPHPNQFVR